MKHLIAILTLLSFTGDIWGQPTGKVLDSLQLRLTTAPNDSTRAKILNELGMKYANQGDYPNSVLNLLASMRIYEKLKNEYEILICRSRLSDVYIFQGEYSTALNYILSAKRGVEDGIIYDQLGTIYLYQNDLNNSFINFKNALNFYREKEDSNIVSRILNDIGTIYEMKKDKNSDSALVYYFESIKIAKSLNNKTNLIGGYASIGDFYFFKKQYLKSKKYENKSLSLAKEIGSLSSMMETELMLSKIDSALNLPYESLEH